MFAPHPQDSPRGLLAVHDSLIANAQLSRACGELRLTVPVINTAWKIANKLQLNEEELEIVPSLSLKRGPSDWSVAPMIGGTLDSDSGILSTLDGLNLSGIISQMPEEATGITKVDNILFSTYIRFQSLSVLWDLADGVTKGHRYGSPKPWVSQELQILGLVSLSEPISDGSKGRPPMRLVINSWGKQFVECTRKYMGLEIPEKFSKMARRLSGNRKTTHYSRTDLLAAGYLARGQELPERIRKQMSDYGREELSKVHGVEL
jgi:hypothetical protein